MAKDLKYSLTVTADTLQAKKEMRALQQQLADLGTKNISGKNFTENLSKGITEARKDVAQLQVALQNAFNMDTGKLDFSKFEQQLAKSGKTLESYGKSLTSLGTEGSKAFLDLTKAVANSEIPFIRVGQRVEALKNTLSNTLRWQISSSVLHGLMGAVQQAYGYAQDLNKSLNNIRIVTGYSADEMAKFADQANRAAQALSTTTTSYTDAALIYYQQGIRDESEIVERVNATIKLSNVSRQSAEEVSSQLTSIWNNFDDGTKKLEYYADAITALGAATASSSSEIAQGLEKFAAISSTVGLSYEYATAALATVVAQTRQSADIVGTSFKTLFGRLEGLKLGETLEDGTDLNKYSKALATVGVNIKEQSGDLKDMDEILDELGAKWKTLSKDQQVALAQTIGGVRQYTQLIALMNNYDKFQENVGIARGSEGELQRQQEIYAESWEAAEKRVKAAWEAIYQDILKDDFFIELTNNIGKFLEQVDKVIDRMGGVKGLLLQITPLLAQLYNKEITSFMTEAAYSMSLMVPGGKEKAERRRSDFVYSGLIEAQKTLGAGTSEYLKYESDIRYYEAIEKHKNQLTEQDKHYLDILNQQKQAEIDKLHTLEEELKVTKEKDKEEERNFIKNKIDPSVKSAKNRQLLISTRGALSQAGLAFADFYNSSDDFTDDDRVKALSSSWGNLKGLNKAYSQGGLGEGPWGLYSLIQKQITAYEEELDKETQEGLTPEQKATIDENKEKIITALNQLIETYFNYVAPGGRISQEMSKEGGLVHEIMSATHRPEINIAKGAMKRAEENMREMLNDKGKDTQMSRFNASFTSGEHIDDIESLTKTINFTSESNREKFKSQAEDYNAALNEMTVATEKATMASREQADALVESTAASDTAANQMKTEALRKKIEEDQRIAEQEAAIRAQLNLDKAGTAERITAISTALSSMVAIGNVATNVLNTLFDDAATPAEKFRAVLQGLVTGFMQYGMMVKNTNWALIENTLFTKEDTIEEEKNTIATAKNAAASQAAAAGKEAEAMATKENTLTSIATRNLSGVGIAGGIVGGIIAGIVTFISIMNKYQDSIIETNKKLKEQNEEIKKWRQENEEALNASHGWKNLQSQLKNNTITQEEYNKELVETAKQLKINNAEILGQAEAYSLLEKEIERTSKGLTDKEFRDAMKADRNARNLMNAGDDDLWQAFLGSPVGQILTGGAAGYSQLYQQLSGDYDNLTNTTKRLGAGAYVDANENKLLKELLGLNIEGVNVSAGGVVSYDMNTMSSAELARLGEFFAKIQQNADAYGGESNELVKAINKLNDDWTNWTADFKENVAIENAQAFREYLEAGEFNTYLNQGLIGRQALIAGAGKFYSEDTVKSVLAEEGQLRESQLETLETVNTFAEEYGFNAVDLLKQIESSGAIADTAMKVLTSDSDLVAAGLKSVGGDFKELTVFMQQCIDQIDLSNLGDELANALLLIDKLKFGDVLKEEDQTKIKEVFEGIDNFVEALPGNRYRVMGSAEDIAKARTEESLKLIDKARASTPAYITSLEKLIENRDYRWTSLEGDRSRIEWLSGQSENDQRRIEALRALKEGGDLSELRDKGLYDALSKEEQEFYYQYDESTFQEKIDALAVAIEDRQKEIDLTQKEIDLYKVENDELERINTLKSNPYAYENELVNEFTTMEELQNLYEKGYISATKFQKEVKNVSIQSAKTLGLNETALKTQAEYLKNNNKYIKGNEEEAYKLALAYESQNAALDDLANNYDTYEKALKNTEKGSEEYASAMDSLQKDMQKLFNVDEEIDEDFILKHLKDIKKASEDDQKAIKKLQTSYAQAIAESANLDETSITTIQKELESIDWGKIEIGADVDTDPALKALWDLTNAGIKDAEKLQAFWNSLGFEMEPIYEEVTDIVPNSWTYGPTGQVPTTTTYKKIVGWRSPNYSGAPHADAKKSKKSSGGKKDKDEEKERYYVINNQIEDQTKLLDRLSKAKDRAFGAAKVSLMDSESKALEKQIELQKQKLKEAEEYYKFDQKNLNAFGAKYGANGELLNYDEIWEREYKRYKKTGDDTRWEDFKKKLKQYEDTRDLLFDLNDDIQDKMNELYDLQLEKIQYKVQIKIDVDDDELKLLEYYLGRIQKLEFSTAEQMANLTNQLDTNLDKQAAVAKGIHDILKNHDITIGQWAAMTDEEKGKVGFTEDEIKQLRDYNNQLIDLQKTIDDLEDKILTGPLEAFKEWNAEFERQEKLIEHNTTLLNNYKDIADLLYTNGSISKQFTLSIMKASLDTMTSGVSAARSELEANRAAFEQAKVAYANATSEDEKARLKKNMDDMEQVVLQSEQDLLNKTKSTLEQARKIFEEEIDRAKEKMQELIHASDWDLTVFDQLKSLDDQWLDDYEKIYHLSKLTRDVNNSINDADTIRHKERLREITQEIADIEESGRQVSQYEVDALRKKYELRLAEIALEDAQAAKSKVRMSRDNEGNWSYVYTADTEVTDKALQNYEDKLYEYQKLNSDFIKNTEEEFLKIQHEFSEKIAEIYKDSSLTKEQIEARVKETTQYYKKLLGGVSNQLDTAFKYNSELYEKDWTDFNRRTGYKISAMEDYQTRIQDSYYGVINPAIDSGAAAQEQFLAVQDKVFSPATAKAMEDWGATQARIMDAAGMSMADYTTLVIDKMDALAKTSDKAASAVSSAAQGMQQDLSRCYDLIAKLNSSSLQNLRTQMTDTAKAVQNLIDQYGALSTASMQDYTPKGASGSNPIKSGSGSGSGDGGGGGGGKGKKTPVEALSEALAYAMKVINMAGGTSILGTMDQTDTYDPKTGKHDTSKESIRHKFARAGLYNWKYFGSLTTTSAWEQAFSTWAWDENKIKEISKILELENRNGSYHIKGFNTGGYTGSWGASGRLAILHEKELILNQEDTKNMLSMINIARGVVEGAAARSVIGNLSMPKTTSTIGQLEQNVHIDASFPNVTDHYEIEQAFNNLVNMASQYANRK